MSNLNKLIVQEYLESLKEDTELDALFPTLLTLMGFRVIANPKDSKGQPQYGKDVIAIGKNESGVKCKYYFEVKGGGDRNITNSVLTKEDGVIESLKEAKYAIFNDFTDGNFANLPAIVVLVHNGEVRRNVRLTFDGFIFREFKDGEFEHWDITKLTEMFSQYMFNEYLLTDEKSLKLFKKTLILLDVPEYDFTDFKQLIDIQIDKYTDIRENRVLKKFLATMNLLANMIFHYSKENNNLNPAKDCVSYIILKLWAWILKNKLSKKKPVLKEFDKILKIQYHVLKEYFNKTLPFALEENGLYGEGGFYEEVGYPIRLFDYINYLTYYFKIAPKFDDEFSLKNSKNTLIKLISNNLEGLRPLLDNHSIAIHNTLNYLVENNENELFTEEEVAFVPDFLNTIYASLCITQNLRKRFPELNNNIEVVIEAIATREKPHNYSDKSSLLITMLFEYLVVFASKNLYNMYSSFFKNKDINLQVFYPDYENNDIEQILFEREILEEGGVETSVLLDENFEDFCIKIKNKPVENIKYITDEVGYDFLRSLAHLYYKTPIFVEEWRKYLKE
ncbi:hypothetical protein [Bernardetia sp. MNP-M8]|uniref:hypothetical protein n=1 Tax=Bernardetia sp. MNP-M8 TaxID=3127470 RepID=UPI0030D38964